MEARLSLGSFEQIRVPRSVPVIARRRSSDWIGLGEASRLLGISEGTLRRWSDDGRLRVFTTPGGHRRFSRRALHALLPSATSRPSLARLGVSPDRLARAYRRTGRRRSQTGSLPGSRWMEGLAAAEREALRERSHRLLGLLLDHLDAPDPETAATLLREAAQLAALQGRTAARVGSSMSEAVEAFLAFRGPFMSHLATTARRRALDTQQATELLMAAETAMDRLLVSTMTGHSLEAGTLRRDGGRNDRHPS